VETDCGAHGMNFHPDGAFVQDMRGVVVKDEESLSQLRTLRVVARSLLAYEVEIRNA